MELLVSQYLSCKSFLSFLVFSRSATELLVEPQCLRTLHLLQSCLVSWMDQLPWPKNADFPPLEIAYVCGDDPAYDGHGYQDYPHRRGWSTPHERHRWMDCPPGMAAIRAQGWLFFGLLKVFLGRMFRKHEYIRLSQKSNVWILDTSILPQRLADLVRSARKGTLARDLDLPNLDSVGEHWNKAFWTAKLEMEMLGGYRNNAMDLTLMLVGLPISILLKSLRRMANRVFLRNDVVPTMCAADLVPAKFSIWQMMESKWCNVQSGWLYIIYSPFLNHYLSGLPRQSTGGNHEACKWAKCVGDNVNEET